MQKKRHLAGALVANDFNVTANRKVESCPQTSRHAQCAGGAVILDGFYVSN